MPEAARTRQRLAVGILGIALLDAACGGGGGGKATPSATATTPPTPTATAIGALAGDYPCSAEGDVEAPTVAYEFSADGSFTIHTGPIDPQVDGTKGTWSVDGDSGVLTIGGEERHFTIEADGHLAFTKDEFPPPDWYVTTYDPPPSVTGFACFPEPG